MNPNFNGLWPVLDTPDKARAACRSGAAAGLLVTSATFVFAVLGTAGVEFAVQLGMDASAFGEGAVFALLSWGMFKCSRIASVLAAILFFVERIVMALNGIGGGGTLLALVILLGFVGAVRGSFAWHQFRETQASRGDTNVQARLVG